MVMFSLKINKRGVLMRSGEVGKKSKTTRQYVIEDKSFFFNETKKMLIQYYIPIVESPRLMAIENHI